MRWVPWVLISVCFTVAVVMGIMGMSFKGVREGRAQCGM
ncbi:hypothetical protein Z950_648 [Sulfitobacter mediterraneus KCTC 32188]|nr:hypothetical protein Z950_648 [Sulfitobacter mediterraneus KCTC 32188]